MKRLVQRYWVVALALAGCTWRGYVKTEDLAKQDATKKVPIVAASDPSLQGTFYVLQPNDENAAVFTEALLEVFKVFGSDAFRDEVRGFNVWMEAPASCETILGDAVLDALDTASFDDLQLLANPVRAANAVTNTKPKGDHHGIVVEPARLEHWTSKCTARKALVVDTLAHELMHVPQTAEQRMRFLDEGVDEQTRGHLVSYRVGWIAACVYLVEQGQEKDVHTCVVNWESTRSARARGDLCQASPT